MRRARFIAAGLLAGAALVSPASAGTKATVTVAVADFSFTPDPVMANMNDTVHFNWVSGFHSTTSGTCNASTCTPDGKWDSGEFTAPHSFDLPAPAPGMYHYYCSVHLAGMQGTLIVNGPTSATFTAFSARPVSRGVAVAWRTASEIDVLGYVVYRQNGARRIPASDLIVGSGTTRGGTYRFVDRRARVTPRLRYLLQVVHADGSRTWFGTVAVI